MIKIYKADIAEITDVEFQAEYNRLSAWQKQKTDNMRNETQKKCSLAGQILLRRGLFELYGLTDYQITYNQNGKPLSDACFFSISHSGTLAVCAFCNRPIGVDIEMLRPVKKRLKYKFFSDEEAEYVNACENDFLFRFFTVWTRKEALLKMRGDKFPGISAESVLQNPQDAVFETKAEQDYILTLCTQN